MKGSCGEQNASVLFIKRLKTDCSLIEVLFLGLIPYMNTWCI